MSASVYETAWLSHTFSAALVPHGEEDGEVIELAALSLGVVGDEDKDDERDAGENPVAAEDVEPLGDRVGGLPDLCEC